MGNRRFHNARGAASLNKSSVATRRESVSLRQYLAELTLQYLAEYNEGGTNGELRQMGVREHGARG